MIYTVGATIILRRKEMSFFNDFFKIFSKGMKRGARRAGSRAVTHAVYDAQHANDPVPAAPERFIAGEVRSVVFSPLPATLAEFAALPEAAMKTPFDTAAMYVAALNVYGQNRDEPVAMMNLLKGPRPMDARELELLGERMGQGGYLARSYLAGANALNNYTPAQPYTAVVCDNSTSYQEQGCARLFVACGGADGPRPITMKQGGDGRWYLAEHTLLNAVQPPV